MEKNKETGQIENRCVKVLRKYRHCVGKQPELVEEVVEESSRPPLLDDGVMGFPPVPGFSVGPPTGGPSPEPSPGMPSELPPRLFEGLFGNPTADVLAKEIFGIEGMQRDAGKDAAPDLLLPACLLFFPSSLPARLAVSERRRADSSQITRQGIRRPGASAYGAARRAGSMAEPARGRARKSSQRRGTSSSRRSRIGGRGSALTACESCRPRGGEVLEICCQVPARQRAHG